MRTPFAPVRPVRALERGGDYRFVLSGGGNLGALQAGAVHALIEAGIEPDLLVGTSVVAPAADASQPGDAVHSARPVQDRTRLTWPSRR